MCRESFLSLSNELHIYPNASVELEEGFLCVKKAEGENEWIFSMIVADMQEEDKEILSCFFSSGTFRFSDKDVLLKWDSDSQVLYAIQQVTLSWEEYLPFRQFLSRFLEAVSEYRNYLTPIYSQ